MLLIHIISLPILFVLTFQFSAAGIDGWVYLLLFFTALKAAAPAQPAIDLSNLQVLSQLAKHFILRPPGAH